MLDRFRFKVPLRAVWNVPESTETLWWPAVEGSEKNMVVLFIPGNPGLVDYYEPFFNVLYDAFDGHVEIVGVSHLGHSPGPHNPPSHHDRVYSLAEQIQHKVRCLDELIATRPKGTRFVLIGHSVGAYISGEVLREREQYVQKVIALFPTVYEIGKTPNGAKLSPLFYRFPRMMLSYGCDLLRALLPSVVFLHLVRTLTGQTSPGLEVTAHKLLNGHVLRNVLYMAHNEMLEIKELDEIFYRASSEKLIFYYSSVDSWAPEAHHHRMLELLASGGMVHLCPDNIPHAFTFRHADVLGKRVAEWLKKLD
ncbi:uncharacterized protein VTP21DRAFT_10854 [Calcarisporiella thermophila]|uniref:uncharacterized protein n=1 Tax=Calcarisporiella thermophila TaxID=911321 RepID=UPI003743A463